MANVKQIGIRQKDGSYTYNDIGVDAAKVDVPNGSSTEALTTTLTSIKKSITDNKSAADTALDGKASTSHASTTGANGKGTTSTFGHVKMGTGIDATTDGVVNVAYGTAAGTACQGNDSRLSNARKNPNALTFGTDTYDGSTAKTLTAAAIGAAPTNHASTGTSYGVGDSSNYGHVKSGTGLTSTSGVLSVNYGTAAGTACQGNDSRLSDNRYPTSHATSDVTKIGQANGTNYGHVKLSDNYTSSAGAASAGVAASSLAVYNCYNTLNSNLSEVTNNLTYVRQGNSVVVSGNATGVCRYSVINHTTTVSMEITPTKIENGLMLAHSLPIPVGGIHLYVKVGNYSAIINANGELELYYPSVTTVSRIDETLTYLTKNPAIL